LHARHMLAEWGLGELADTTQLLVSELMTNALEATIRHQLPTPLRLRLSSDGQHVLIEVWDAAPAPSQLPPLEASHPTSAEAEAGRGLCLVAALSQRWSFYRLTERGKVVWAEVAP
jgi:anti-sigma regulatory factor (Ser/Thr protein kinase)